MNKLVNHPDNMVTEMLEGYLAINPGKFERVEGTNGFINANKREKVSVIVAGGAGNEPWQIGYVGDGMADGAMLGQVYTAPPSRGVLNVARATYHEKGVLYIATNHAGDVLNFELVRELGELEGISGECVFAKDDITSSEDREDRRGVAGVALVVKIAGGASAAGLSLEEVARVSRKAADNIYTLSVTTSPGYMPRDGKAMFELPEGEIEYGMGFNGEPGILRTKLAPADEVADTLMKYILDDMQLKEGEDVIAMINGFGFTSQLEMLIFARRVHEILAATPAGIHKIILGNMFSPQGTGGLSVTVMRADDELKKYFDMNADSPLVKFGEVEA